jgi:hypothetical protein
MAALLELLPMTNIDETSWSQPLDSIVDVSGYTEAGMMIDIPNMNVASGTTTIQIATAVDNRDEQYVPMYDLQYTAAPSEPKKWLYFADSCDNGQNQTPGFARYLRVLVDQQSGSSVTLGIKAVLKP